MGKVIQLVGSSDRPEHADHVAIARLRRTRMNCFALSQRCYDFFIKANLLSYTVRVIGTRSPSNAGRHCPPRPYHSPLRPSKDFVPGLLHPCTHGTCTVSITASLYYCSSAPFILVLDIRPCLDELAPVKHQVRSSPPAEYMLSSILQRPLWYRASAI